MANTIIQLGGLFCLAFAVFHILFWKIFRWQRDLPKLMPVNRAIMQVLNLRLTYVFIVFGVASIVFANELTTTDLGKFITVSISVFWFMRAIEQLLFFDRKDRVSIAMFLIFVFGGVIYLVPFIA